MHALAAFLQWSCVWHCICCEVHNKSAWGTLQLQYLIGELINRTCMHATYVHLSHAYTRTILDLLALLMCMTPNFLNGHIWFLCLFLLSESFNSDKIVVSKLTNCASAIVSYASCSLTLCTKFNVIFLIEGHFGCGLIKVGCD